MAERAQVSTATVSRVLSGRRSKEDDIARRVRRAGEEISFESAELFAMLHTQVRVSSSNRFI